MKSDNVLHTPVMVAECLDFLAPAFDVERPILVDATVGLGGHSEAALQAFPALTVIGIDRDLAALHLAQERLAPFGDRFIPFHGTYDEIPEALQGELADGILMDLGVSSMQLDNPDRGFAYAKPAVLDMRMDERGERTAAIILADSSERELAGILRKYGEERFAPRIARAIVARRETSPITTTDELVEVVRSAIPAAARRKGGNPAKRTFQAIRVAVNEELDILSDALPAALSSLRVGGRIVVESYQSLEDRIVKRVFAEGATPEVPADLPLVADEVERGTRLRLLTRGAMKPDLKEQEQNPRSKSARLRAAELVAPWRENV